MEPVQSHTQNATEDGAEESVAAAEPGAGHIRAHAEDGADAGEGGITVDEELDHSAQGGRHGGLDVAHADVEGVMIVGIRHLSSLH